MKGFGRCDQRMKPFRFGIVEAVDAPSGIKVLTKSEEKLIGLDSKRINYISFNSLKFFQFLHFRFSVTFSKC